MAALALAAALAGCSGEGVRQGADAPAPTTSAPVAPAPSAPGPTTGPTPTPTTPPSSTPPSTPPSTRTGPARFDTDRALRHVRVLAGRIGPRLATGPAYRRAAGHVARTLRGLGYLVERQDFPVPAGDSWGVPVEAGRSANVVARPPGLAAALAAGSAYLLVGAHLDTVAVAPGGEDNASGVAVLLEVARLASGQSTRLPVVFVAFGAEEPRGPGDDLHHFGSRHLVGGLRGARRDRLAAVVSLDRVGVGATVPVCHGGLSDDRVVDALLRAARRAGVSAQRCTEPDRASDHWSFEKAGFDVARLGSTPYAGYHSAADVPAVVQPEQLGRTGRLTWAWLRRPGR